MVTHWYGHVDNLSTPALLRLFRGGAMLAKVFGRRKSKAAANDTEAASLSYEELNHRDTETQRNACGRRTFLSELCVSVSLWLVIPADQCRKRNSLELIRTQPRSSIASRWFLAEPR